MKKMLVGLAAMIIVACPRNSSEMAVVLMGHGTEHPANSAYSQMANILAADHENVFLGTVEGYPGYDEVLAGLKESEVRKVRLIPFLVVAGDHALNDLSGNESDSWKSMLEKEGFETDSNLVGMGENDEIVQIFVQHTKEAFARIPDGGEWSNSTTPTPGKPNQQTAL